MSTNRLLEIKGISKRSRVASNVESALSLAAEAGRLSDAGLTPE